MIDWSATAAWIALIVAIASPIFTSILNNRHTYKMKRLEMYEERRICAFEAYLRSVQEVVAIGGQEARTNYGRAYGEILLYLPTELAEKANQIDRMFQKAEFFTSRIDLEKVRDLCLEIIKYYNDRGKTPRQPH